MGGAKTSPSNQCKFCNYLRHKSLISQGWQSGSIGQSYSDGLGGLSGLPSQGGQDGQCCQVGPGCPGGHSRWSPWSRWSSLCFSLSMMFYISELRMEAHTSSVAIRLIWIVTQH